MPAELKVVGLQKIINAMEAKIPGAIQRSTGDRLVEIVNEARAAWPVKTGKSANALRIRAAKRGDGQFVWKIGDPMPYAGAVHFKGDDPEDTCAESLVFEPIEELLTEMLSDFGSELARG